jgi:acetyl esterase/lipase
MSKIKAPPAIFTCGTLDPLLDDSVLMATKWTMSGAEAVLKLYPGTWMHGAWYDTTFC